MLSIILNYILPSFIAVNAILFAVSIKKELREHSLETKCKYKQLEADINQIKDEIHDIPKHSEMADLIKTVKEKDAQVSKILVELPERLKHHNLQSANQISDQLKLAFQVLLHDELQNYNLVKTAKK